jgi:hypothetical protein
MIPRVTLPPHGLLAVWTGYGSPLASIDRFPGRDTTIGGRPARIATNRPLDRSCASLDADRSVTAAIQRGVADNWLLITVCIRGPNVDALAAQALTMIRSARLND